MIPEKAISGAEYSATVRPLVLVDDVVVAGKVANPDEMEIDNVRFVRQPDEEMTKKYGEKAVVNGILIITTNRKAL